MKNYNGQEPFTVSGIGTGKRLVDFWKWAYSDLIRNTSRAVLAEYVVATALGVDYKDRVAFAPYDLLTRDGYRVEVKSAARVQLWGIKHPERLTFRVAPARLPDETGDYKEDAPMQRNSDVYVFTIYDGLSMDEDPLNLDLWEFMVLPTVVLDEMVGSQKVITLKRLETLGPTKCDYLELSETISSVMDRIEKCKAEAKKNITE